MTARSRFEGFCVVERQYGKVLRLQTREIDAMNLAIDLLGFLEAELDADVEDTGWKQGYGLAVAKPITIQLESLVVELTTDGNEVRLRRVSGRKHEFDDLCSLICE